MNFELYTDGSCLGNPGRGGWAALIKNIDTGEEKTISGGEEKTTNNRMELLAILNGLKALPLCSQNNNKIKIYSDSSYCVKGISEWLPGWVRCNFKDKKNVDLWKEYLVVSKNLDIVVEWVRAHNGHPENELVDSVARAEASELPRH